MKNIRSLNFNKKFLTAVTVLSLGYLGANIVDKKLEEIYKDRKLDLEEAIESVLDKNIELGDYKGLRVFGFGISKSKIFENENINSKIEAGSVYVGIMPIKSFLNQKWVIKISPKKASINVSKDFLKREKSLINNRLVNKKVKYDLNFYIKEFADLKINDLYIESKIRGNFKYSSNPRKIVGYINAKFNNKDNLKFKFNTKLNQNESNFQILSKGINLRNFNFNNFNRGISLNSGKFKSNFKFYRTPTKSYCKGSMSLNNVVIKALNLEENINTENLKFNCEKNNLKVSTNTLRYGSLISNLNFDIPLKVSMNNISLDGIIKYSANPKSKIKISANLPYWIDKRGLNFGNLSSNFKLTRTELANLNIFRKNGIEGLITAEGDLRGNLLNPDLNINFNVNNPNYKGIKFREAWVGEIRNKNNAYQINIKSKRSPIPSFLTLNFDSNIKLNNLILSRLKRGNKGTLNIIRNNNDYSWNAINLPLDELEFSTNISKSDRISGTLNGAGILSGDLSSYSGKVGWSFGKFRNLDLKTSYFDFEIEDNKFYVDAFVIPEDGGIIKILYDSNKDEILDLDFENITTEWTILNAINTFKINDKESEIKPKKEAKYLNVLEIINQEKDLIDQLNAISLINEYKKNKRISENRLGFKKFFRKFESRYSGNLTISGHEISNYKIASEINGFIDLKTNSSPQNKKEYFSLKLEGGLFEGKGNLLINQIPLKSINIFLEDEKDFKGVIDLALNYDLDKQDFEAKLFTINSSIKDYELSLEKGEINYNKKKKNSFDLDFSLLFNDKNKAITLSGFLPSNKNGIFKLNLAGESELLKLIDVFYGEIINFKKGKVELDLKLIGPITQFNKPIYSGDLIIKDSEISILNNTFKNINSNIEIFDGDQVNVKSFSAFGEKKGGVIIRGTLPIYKEKVSKEKVIRFISDEFNLVSENNDLILNSDINVSGSFQNPTLGGKVALNNGFINIKNSKKNNNNENINKRIINNKNLQDRLYIQNNIADINTEEEITISELLTTYLKPKYLFNLNFDKFKVIIGPNFRLGYSNIFQAYLETPSSLEFNKSLRDENDDDEVDLKIKGLILAEKGRVGSRRTPFKLVRNNNSIAFASGLGIKPLVNINLTTKVPDSIVEINQNNQDDNIADDLSTDDNSKAFGAVGIGNSRKIKIDASYYGVINKISNDQESENFWFNRLELRSTPSRSKSEIGALIIANSADLLNKAFFSPINTSNVFNQRFQLSLYPALIDNKEPVNNVFSKDDLEIDDTQDSSSNDALSTQAWVAEIGLDINDRINFSVQATPERDDIPPLGLLTIQATPYLELLGSLDSEGDWKSKFQLFFRY